jgi:hydroxymethylbilane synthase
MPNFYRIGTRKSPLAIKQTEIVLEALKKAHPHDTKIHNAKVVGITTTGDTLQGKNLSEFGGKALFVKEIEQALLDNIIDFGVHSLKDVEANLHPNFKLACVLEREIINDVLITRNPEKASLATLKPQAIVGTCSPRRAAQLLDLRPDIKIVPLHGNVSTRLAKLENEGMDAIVLAFAGLKRLGVIEFLATHHLSFSGLTREPIDPRVEHEDDKIVLKNHPQFNACILTLDEMIPAVGQGALTVETLCSNQPILELLKPINDQKTETCIRVERAFLRERGGDCKTPVAAYATVISEKNLVLKTFYAPLQGVPSIRLEALGDFDDPEELGIRAGKEIKRLGDQL